MAATPQYGTMCFVGIRTGKTYSKDIYLSDVAEAMVRWDGGAGASSSSPDSWRPPEPVILVDYSQVTGTADTTKIILIRDGQPTGDILRYTIHLTSLSNRPRLRIGFSGKTDIAGIQKA